MSRPLFVGCSAVNSQTPFFAVPPLSFMTDFFNVSSGAESGKITSNASRLICPPAHPPFA